MAQIVLDRLVATFTAGEIERAIGGLDRGLCEWLDFETEAAIASSPPCLTVVALPRSCAGRANRSQWCGAGRRVSWRRALPG